MCRLNDIIVFADITLSESECQRVGAGTSLKCKHYENMTIETA